MTLRQSILALLVLFAIPVWAGENDELGLWSEFGIEKAITKSWDVGLDLEYRAQNKSRFSVGLGTSYKVCKYLKLGISYNFLESYRPDKYKETNNLLEKIAEAGQLENHLQDPDNLEYYPSKWKTGYNHTFEYWFPRHRFSVEATGTIKLWKWLKISLRERYQLTHCRARTTSKYKYRNVYEIEESWIFPEDWSLDPTIERSINQLAPEEEWAQETKPAYTDQVLRSRLKFEYDKKRVPFSPFVSAEFHNSVSKGDHMLLQKIRTAIGCSYKFRKHNEVSLSYITTFDMYDIEDYEVVRLYDKLHTINIGYKYSF